MSLTKNVIDYLVSKTEVTSIIGDRIYPNKLRQEQTWPAVTVQRIGETPVDTLDVNVGDSELDQAAVQIDSWGRTVGEAEELAAAIRSVLHSYKGALGEGTCQQASLRNAIDDFEPDTDVYRVIQRYEVWHTE